MKNILYPVPGLYCQIALGGENFIVTFCFEHQKDLSVFIFYFFKPKKKILSFGMCLENSKVSLSLDFNRLRTCDCSVWRISFWKAKFGGLRKYSQHCLALVPLPSSPLGDLQNLVLSASEAMDRGTGDHGVMEQAGKEMAFEEPLGRASHQGNSPPFKNNFKDADARRVRTCPGLAPATGLDFTDGEHLARTQVRYKFCLLSLENRLILT